MHSGFKGRNRGLILHIVAHNIGGRELEWRKKGNKERREKEATSPYKSSSGGGAIEMGNNVTQKSSTSTPSSLKKEARKGSENQKVTY